MKKIMVLLAIMFSGFQFIFAQSLNKKLDEKFVYYYRTPSAINTDFYTVTIEDIVSKTTMCKMKIKISNKTANYLIFKGSEVVFKYKHGEYRPIEKDLIIKPFESGSKVINVTGKEKYQADTFTLIINGFYAFPAKGNMQAAPEFQLPATINSFTAGTFSCNMVNVKKETAETAVRFNCTYNGEQMGIIDPAKAVVELEGGQEFANGKINSQAYSAYKGGK